MSREPVVTELSCSHCGRAWHATGGWTGFLHAAVAVHRDLCANRTPGERLKIAKRDLKRHAKNRPRSRIHIPLNHAGLIGGVAP